MFVLFFTHTTHYAHSDIYKIVSSRNPIERPDYTKAQGGSFPQESENKPNPSPACCN